ncbi:MAG TPA: DUF6687 family protein [Pirellulales bacterium]|jgi:hypothetical protein|nr:DUF6687 family protein [Pirellulales bacterium]
MIERFEIVGPTSTRPDAERIIFCDGTGGGLFHAETDLELSHWRPNQAPVDYRAGTSTEICFRFLDNPRPGSWTVAVNNHLDVDGILSVYVLVHSDHALAHRQTIVEAADMGDFWGWGESAAQRLFQGLTRLVDSDGEGTAVYTEAFRRIPALIDGTDPAVSDLDNSLAPLRRGVELVAHGQIARRLISDRLAHYIMPLAVAGSDDARASYAPEFNEAISDKAALWPQVRARWDTERLCLVSVERATGWLHDLWFPGYLWADTEGKWRLPGLSYHDGMRSYELDHPGLIATFEQLQRQETAPGQWALGGTSLPFGGELQRQFPLGGRLVDERGNAAISQISPERIAATFERANVGDPPSKALNP